MQRPPDPYMAGKLSSRRVDRARARLLSAAHSQPVHGGMCRAARGA